MNDKHDKGAMQVDVTLVRETIKVTSVRSRMLEPGYGYVRISTFQADTGADFQVQLDRLQAQAGGHLRGLVLDLHNLHTNARNHRFDAMALLRELELAHVGEIHVAGGMELDGYYLDAHSDTVADAVWPLLEYALPRCPNIGGVVFELFGSWVDAVGLAPVRADLQRLQALWRQAQPTRRRPQPLAAQPRRRASDHAAVEHLP